MAVQDVGPIRFTINGLTLTPISVMASAAPADSAADARALGDNAFDTAVAVLAGQALGNASTPRQATPAFPYLSATQPSDLPPLIDYFRSPRGSPERDRQIAGHLP